MKDSQKIKTQKKVTKDITNPFLHGLIFLAAIAAFVVLLTIFIAGKAFTTQLTPLKSRPITVAPYPQLLADTDPNLSAQAVLVYDRNARVKVFEKNATTRFTPASTVKVMTALVALDTYDLRDILTARGVARVEGSTMGLAEGERIRVRDLLYGLMLPSGNDAAYTLASNYPDGGHAGFVKRMNEKAKEIGLYNTRYLDPSGLEDGNYTTPQDLARLADTALDNETFQEVVHTKKITVSDVSGQNAHELENLNKLLDFSDVYGIKTGFTNEAGQVLLTSINNGGGEYIVVVMKSEDRFRDTQILMADIIRNIELKKF